MKSIDIKKLTRFAIELARCTDCGYSHEIAEDAYQLSALARWLHNHNQRKHKGYTKLALASSLPAPQKGAGKWVEVWDDEAAKRDEDMAERRLNKLHKLCKVYGLTVDVRSDHMGLPLRLFLDPSIDEHGIGFDEWVPFAR